MTEIIRTKQPYTYEELKALEIKSGADELQEDYYGFGSDKKVLAKDVDSFTMSDSMTRKIKRFVTETFLDISDGDEESSAVILYDVELEDYALSDSQRDEYMNKDTPLNYTPLRPLIPGEYEYKNAIVGIQMSLPPVEGRFGIIGSTLHVDVPDTIEKGTLTLGEAPSTVKLKKKFYKETKVLCSLVEASEPCNIVVTESGLDGFTVGLLSLTNSSVYVNGTIDWLVDGY
jgi:hypothetical protein